MKINVEFAREFASMLYSGKSVSGFYCDQWRGRLRWHGTILLSALVIFFNRVLWQERFNSICENSVLNIKSQKVFYLHENK